MTDELFIVDKFSIFLALYEILGCHICKSIMVWLRIFPIKQLC